MDWGIKTKKCNIYKKATESAVKRLPPGFFRRLTVLPSYVKPYDVLRILPVVYFIQPGSKSVFTGLIHANNSSRWINGRIFKTSFRMKKAEGV